MNKHLHKAKINNNDEFYTKYEDIENELAYYREQLKGKLIYCNCDTINSNFYKYFCNNAKRLGIKDVIISSIDKYGNGSFDCPENIAKTKESDIIITNPPFSISTKKFIPMLINLNKKFLIVSQLTQICSKNVFPHIMEKRFRLGYTKISGFLTADGALAKFGNICWLTNLNVHKKDLIDIENKNENFLHYLNIDAIDVPNIKNIPLNYKGLMLVPVTFLEYLTDPRFYLVGCCNYNGKYGRNDIGIRPIGQEWIDKYFADGHTGHYTKNMNLPVYYDNNGYAKSSFARIAIKNKE